MKKITFYLFGMLFSICSFAQSNKKTTMNLVMPVFVDSSRFIKELAIDKNVRNLYAQYKKKHDYVIYKYDFNISPLGKVVPGIYGKEASLTGFIINKFNKYKWKPACRSGLKKAGYGNMDINLIPSKNIIQIQIHMSDGSINNQKIIKTIMDKVIIM